MTTPSSRTTGNEPIESIDPGGTRPRPGGKDPAAGGSSTQTDKLYEQEVRSGDQNEGVRRP